ncbi:MAG TPA: hypothetical protein VF594_04310, partial [Rubricoccaceae bacterium]
LDGRTVERQAQNAAAQRVQAEAVAEADGIPAPALVPSAAPVSEMGLMEDVEEASAPESELAAAEILPPPDAPAAPQPPPQAAPVATLNDQEQQDIQEARTLAADPESDLSDDEADAFEALIRAEAQARAEQSARRAAPSQAAPAPVLNASEQAQIALARERVADPESDIDEDAAAQIEAVLTQRAQQRAADADAARRAKMRAEDAELLALIGRAPAEPPGAQSSTAQPPARSGDGQAGPPPALDTAREESQPTPTPTPPPMPHLAPTAAPQRTPRATPPRRLGESAPRVMDARTGQPAGPTATRRARLEYLAAQMQDDTPAELPEQWQGNPPETLDEMAEAAIDSGDPHTILQTHAYVTGEAERQLDPVQNPEVLYAQVRVGQEEASDMLLNGRPERRAYLQTRAERSVSRAPTVQEQLDRLASDNGLSTEDAYGSAEGNQQAVLTVEGFQAFTRQYPRGLADVRAAALRPARQIEADFKQRTGLPLTPRTRRDLDAYRALVAAVTEAEAQAALDAAAATFPDPDAFRNALRVLAADHMNGEGVDWPALHRTLKASGIPSAFSLSPVDADALLDEVRTLAGNAELDAESVERNAPAGAVQPVQRRPDDAADAGRSGDPASGLPEYAAVEGAGPAGVETPGEELSAGRGQLGAPLAATPAPPADAFVDRFGAVLEPEVRQRWERAFDAARTVGEDETAPVDRADGLALSVAAGDTPDVTDAEYAGLLLRASDLQAQLDSIERQAVGMIEEGREESAGVLRRQAGEVGERLDRTVTAADKLAWGLRSPFAARQLRPDAASFTAEAVKRRATVEKGAVLSLSERESIDAALARLRAAEARLYTLEGEALGTADETAAETARKIIARAQQARERHEATAAEAKDGAERREKRREAILAARERIKGDLRALGLRVNDVTGLTIEGAGIVARLAVNFAQGASLTLGEIVARVQQDLPDVSAAEIVAALASPKRPERVRTTQEIERARVERARAQKAVRAAVRALRPRSRWEWFAELAGAPRALKATGDFSAVLRQGAILIVRRPGPARIAFVQALKAAFSEFEAERIDQMIREDGRQFARE